MTDLFNIEAAAPEQPKPPRKVCGTCKHYQPYRDEITRRIHTSKPGRCGWQLPEFAWPLSVERAGGTYVSRITVWRTMNAKDCKCWDAKK